MKIEYESTIEEATEAGFRLMELSGQVSTQKWVGLAFAPIFFGASYFLMDNYIRMIAFGVFATVVYVIVYLMTYKKHIKKRIRNMLVKAMGTDEPIPCEYEIDKSGLIFRMLGQELKFAWTNVATVNATDTSIEIIMKPTGVAIIPMRIFSSPEQMESWIQLIGKNSTEKLSNDE